LLKIEKRFLFVSERDFRLTSFLKINLFTNSIYGPCMTEPHPMIPKLIKLF